MKPITVLLAEDHLIVREGLVGLLSMEKDIKVVGEAENGHQALELAQKLQPDVVVMDIAMPLLNGIETTRQLLVLRPNSKVIILSAHGDEAYVERVLSHGALGYLLKQSSSQILSKGIREVAKGKIFIGPSLIKNSNQYEPPTKKRGSAPAKFECAKLTAREAEVLQLVAEGLANKQSADVLHISIKTVEKHRQSLMEKLHIHDTAGLTRYAVTHGFIESSVQATTLPSEKE